VEPGKLQIEKYCLSQQATAILNISCFTGDNSGSLMSCDGLKIPRG